jgi:hypothetical protein
MRKYFVPLFFTAVIISGCSKNDSLQTPNDPNPNYTKLLGTWYNFTFSDSMFYQDGSFYKYVYATTDTTSYGKQTHYMTYNDNGTIFTPITAFPTPTLIRTTFYDFITEDTYSETDVDLLTGNRSGDPFDSVTIKKLTSSDLILNRVRGNYFFDGNGNQVYIREHIVEQWIK